MLSNRYCLLESGLGAVFLVVWQYGTLVLTFPIRGRVCLVIWRGEWGRGGVWVELKNTRG